MSMTDAELSSALEWALKHANSPYYPVARATLEAVRWFQKHEHVAGECPECEAFHCGDVACEDCGGIEHKDGCTVGQWVRAAARAGL